MLVPGKATIIIDGQFGSTGKGLIAGYVAQRGMLDIAVGDLSPNAGHTCIIGGKKFITHQLPMAALINRKCKIFIPAGAVVDPDQLFRELMEFNIDRKRLMIDPRAAVVTGVHVAAEKGADELQAVGGISSTLSGTGAARACKIARAQEACLVADCAELANFRYDLNLNREMEGGAAVLIETGQGFGLGIDSGFDYPHCTSKEVSVSQTLSDCQIHPCFLGRTIMTLRTYPIRVGGTSGPFYPDSMELTWKELGQPEELTTVTKKVRRIATFSELQFIAAVEALKPSVLFLNFCNYMKKSEVDHLVRSLRLLSAASILCGWGPSVEEIRPAPVLHS